MLNRIQWIVALAVVCGLGSRGFAATVTFGTPTSINGGGTNSCLDVNYPSPIVQAGWVGTGTATVSAPQSGSITFNHETVTTAAPSGTVTGLFQAGGPELNNSAIFTNPGSLVGTDLKAVLTDHAFETAVATPLVLRLGGLTAGQAYSAQLFVIDDRSTKPEVLEDTSNGSGNNSAAFNSNANDYVLANFTADASTQDIYVIASPATVGHDLNAFVLRAVPEPSSAALLAAGAFGLLARRRRPATKV